MTPRETFIQQGKLTKCPNPVHEIDWKRFIANWQWAADSWSSVTESGLLETHFIKASRQETADGITAYHLVIWRFQIHFAFIKEPS